MKFVWVTGYKLKIKILNSEKRFEILSFDILYSKLFEIIQKFKILSYEILNLYEFVWNLTSKFRIRYAVSP